MRRICPGRSGLSNDGTLNTRQRKPIPAMSAGPTAEVETLYGDYPLDHAFDEMREANGDVRAHYRALAETLARLRQDELQRWKQSAELSFLTQGITFTVYGGDEGTGRILPYKLLTWI